MTVHAHCRHITDDPSLAPLAHIRRIAKAASAPDFSSVGRVTDVSFPTIGDACDAQTCAAMLCRLFKFVLNALTQVHQVR